MPTHARNPAMAAIHALYNIALGQRQRVDDIPDAFGDAEPEPLLTTHETTAPAAEQEESRPDALAGHTREATPPPDAEETGMDKTPLVQALIAHAQTAWQPEDAALLNTFTPEQLTKLQEEADARAATATIPASAPPEEDDETEPAAAQATPAPAATQEPAKEAVTLEAIERLMDSKFTTFEQRLTEKAELPERQQLLTQLAVHGFTETDLTPMPTGSLRKLLSTLAPASYAGMGLPALHTQSADDGPDDDPKWD